MRPWSTTFCRRMWQLISWEIGRGNTTSSIRKATAKWEFYLLPCRTFQVITLRSVVKFRFNLFRSSGMVFGLLVLLVQNSNSNNSRMMGRIVFFRFKYDHLQLYSLFRTLLEKWPYNILIYSFIEFISADLQKKINITENFWKFWKHIWEKLLIRSNRSRYNEKWEDIMVE